MKFVLSKISVLCLVAGSVWLPAVHAEMVGDTIDWRVVVSHVLIGDSMFYGSSIVSNESAELVLISAVLDLEVDISGEYLFLEIAIAGASELRIELGDLDWIPFAGVITDFQLVQESVRGVNSVIQFGPDNVSVQFTDLPAGSYNVAYQITATHLVPVPPAIILTLMSLPILCRFKKGRPDR